jgi:hypothetical protein
MLVIFIIKTDNAPNKAAKTSIGMRNLQSVNERTLGGWCGDLPGLVLLAAYGGNGFVKYKS